MHKLYDASTPPVNPPDWRVCGGYFGDDTPHQWSVENWNSQGDKDRLPILPYAGLDQANNAQDLMHMIHEYADMVGMPTRGITIVLDTEDRVYYNLLKALDELMMEIDLDLMNYGSLDAIVKNYLPKGGRWVADWNDRPHLIAGIQGEKALQFADAEMAGTDYDESVIDRSVRLWTPHQVGTPWYKVARQELTKAEAHLHNGYTLLAHNTPNV